MSTYDSATYKLEFADNYASLNVVKRSDSSIAQTFDLSSGHTISYEDGDYEINGSNQTTWFTTGVKPSELPLAFNASRLEGIGTTNIRDIGRAHYQVTYYLENCEVELKYSSGVPYPLLLNSPCNDPNNCTGPQAACSDIVEVPEN